MEIGYEDVLNIAKDIHRQYEDFESYLGRVKAINEQLDTFWKGKAASKYSTNVLNKIEEMKNAAKAIEDVSVFLREAVNIFKNTEEGLADRIL